MGSRVVVRVDGAVSRLLALLEGDDYIGHEPRALSTRSDIQSPRAAFSVFTGLLEYVYADPRKAGTSYAQPV